LQRPPAVGLPLIAQQNPQPPASGSSGKLDQVQSQVNEVKDILKDNIDKVLERGDRLNELIDKTDDLQASVSGATPTVVNQIIHSQTNTKYF
uniref:V-SNARE coiled-coil homology domain-containing protein n=1 Tax=Oryzias sinensis TaxID=183150 RepID=A0A8C7YDZ8_9TELE